MSKDFSVDDLILNYDPEAPAARFKDAGVAGALKSSTGRLPSVVPWPQGHAPTAVPLSPAPSPTDDLSRFAGYDAIVVTYTAAEASALASLFTPDYLPSRWYEYKYNVAAYIPLVTGSEAPFNDNSSEMERYYHCLGLYFPCTIGSARVLLFKSGLHLDYDGPAIPVRKLMLELAQTINPKLFITTGTGGGIGADVALGDVVIASRTQFDCTTQFKSAPFATSSYQTSPLPAGALTAISPALTSVNAKRIPGAHPTPTIWTGAALDAVVTTDFFGFDDSTDYYKLQGLGRACDMGDAMVGNAMQDCPNIAWYAVRNASDPQIPDPSGDITAAGKKASEIYSEWGAFTTAASAIATWAIIDASFNPQATQPVPVTTGGSGTPPVNPNPVSPPVSTAVRLPINNVLLGSDYTGTILAGANQTPLNVLLDTGSSTLAVNGKEFNPTKDPGTKTTKLAQEVQYGSGSWVGAVVQTSIGLSASVTLQNVYLAVTYLVSDNMFGKADGIFGLAYEPLNNAYQMPGDTWKAKYDADRIEQQGKEADLDPYFNQLEQAGIVSNLFAFYTKRSIVSAATTDPATDPLNQGIFVIGGGPECTDLYTGSFTDIAVVDDLWYNTNLLNVQVGNQPAIKVAPVPAGSSNASNSIVDSGTNSLVIDQTLYNQILAGFRAINPEFATLLQTYALTENKGYDQTQLDLSTWPNISFTLQGANGDPATLTITPANYWQFDVEQAGKAVANIYSDGGQLGGQSILGLPLFNGYFTVFNRTLDGGRGVISFATRT